MITVYKALDRGGLDVKGTTIINYDESNSETRRTGRKTEEFVQKILKSGKIVLKKIMEEMGSQGNLAGRINEATILLRVM